MALERELAVYQKERANLERDHKGKFVLIKDDAIVGTFDSFQNAANEGLRQFGNNPFLIREIGQDKANLSVAVLYGLSTRGDHPYDLQQR